MRELLWDGCLNARDLGGLPLERGGATRHRAVVRADNVRHLTDEGWRQLVDYGIRTVVDLRFDEERRSDGGNEPPVTVVPVSLFGRHDPVEAARVDDLVRGAPDEGTALARFYLDVLDTCAAQVAAAMEAVAGASGGVVVHCYVGKDRTGVVSALLLRLAGVTADAVAADYALSAGRVGPLVSGWIEEADDDVERDFRRRISGAPREGMALTLAGLEERWGDAESYLRTAGLSARDVARARHRLV